VTPDEALAERVVIVLVQPQHPGNVGAAARAMKNFGLHRLVLVDPPCYDPEQARWMAPGCSDILAGARIVATTEEALSGVHRAIASTARHRKQGQSISTPGEVSTQFFDDVAHDPAHTTAILFGREDFGLSNEDVQRCESVLRIPTPEHASLNLGQAVLLVGHNLFEEARARGADASGRTLGGSRGTTTTGALEPKGLRDMLADFGVLEPAVADLVMLLERVGYLRGVPADKVRLTARQALQRARVSVRHVEALRGMLNRITWALDHPDTDWKSTRRRH
jgi:TrmH family RNA methyltransferase